jgi:hypothetical protein
MKTLSTTVRFKNVRMENVPTTSFPDMVEIVLTPTILKSIKGKKFVTLDKAKIAIDALSAFSKIKKYKMSEDEKELRTLNY